MANCQQCGKPAMYRMGSGALLCLDCAERAQLMAAREFEQNAAMINHLLGQMENITGLPPGSLGPGINIPKPVIHRGPAMTFNNIKVDRSVVGAINTGQAQVIDVAVSYIKHVGDPALSEALREFTQAILDTKDIDQRQRAAIIEQLSFLTSQVAAKKEKQQGSVARAVLRDLGGYCINYQWASLTLGEAGTAPDPIFRLRLRFTTLPALPEGWFPDNLH